MTYLCPLLQQQLHTVSISDHTCTVQGLKCTMHPIHISSLRHTGDTDVNIMDDTKNEYLLKVALEDKQAYLTNKILHIVMGE